MTSIYQIILGLVALLFISNGLIKFFSKESKQTLFKLFSVIIIWGIIFAFSVFPQATHVVSKKLGFGENLNTLIFTGFVAVFIILFKLLNIIEKLERNISEIVRKEALGRLKNNPKEE